MTRQEAKQAIIDGHKVSHNYYGSDEYLFMNEAGLLETEDGYTKGSFISEFWVKYQIWETGWRLFEGKTK